MNDIYVTVTGWVARDPELRVSNEGNEWATLRVGSTPRRRTPAGTWVDGVTQWFDVKVFGKFARNVTSSIKQGHPVTVSGRLLLEEWKSDDGPRSRQVIHAQTIGHDLTRGEASFTRVRYESGPEGVVDVTGAEELAEGTSEEAADEAQDTVQQDTAQQSTTQEDTGQQDADQEATERDLTPVF